MAAMISTVLAVATIALSGSIGIEWVEPAEGTRVSTTVILAASISSTTELTSVTATSGSVSATVFFDGSHWKAELDLSAFVYGPITVTWQATNAENETAARDQQLFVDRPPKTIEAPLRPFVATPSVGLLARCEDDGPGPCRVEVRVAERNPSESIDYGPWEAEQSFEATLCLAALDARPDLELQLILTDDAGRTGGYSAPLIVNASPHLEPAVTVDGALEDLDADRILYRGRDGVARIVSRTDPEDVVELGPQADTCRVCGLGCARCEALGRLTPFGAALYSNRVVYDARVGQSWTVIRDTTTSDIYAPPIEVAGDHVVVWSQAYRLSSQTAVDLAGCLSPVATAEALYCTRGAQIVRKEAGGTETPILTASSDVTHYAVAEPYFLYEDSEGLRLLGPGGTVDISEAETGSDARVAADGWVAFEKASGLSQQQQVWLRPPDGPSAQATVFGEPTELESLAPGGQATVRSTTHRFVVRPDQAFSDLGGHEGRILHEAGSWHVLQANTAFRVTTTEGGFYDAPVCEAVCSGPSCEDTPDPEPSPARGCGGCSGTGAEGMVFALLAWLGIRVRRARG